MRRKIHASTNAVTSVAIHAASGLTAGIVAFILYRLEYQAVVGDPPSDSIVFFVLPLSVITGAAVFLTVLLGALSPSGNPWRLRYSLLVAVVGSALLFWNLALPGGSGRKVGVGALFLGIAAGMSVSWVVGRFLSGSGRPDPP